MEPTVIQKRNIVVLGKTGAGKSTVANKITGTNAFTVSSCFQSVTRHATHSEVKLLSNNIEYNFKVVDTVGLFDTKVSNSTIIKDVKTYFRDKVPEGVNIVLFVFKQGRYTKEEEETFKFLIDHFSGHISIISALIITGCEDLDPTGRQKLVEEFSTNDVTQKIARFCKKGIYPVGFPDTTNMKPRVKEVYEVDMQEDINLLRNLVMTCGEMRIGKELFQDDWWDAFHGCTVL